MKLDVWRVSHAGFPPLPGVSSCQGDGGARRALTGEEKTPLIQRWPFNVTVCGRHGVTTARGLTWTEGH